MPERLVTMAKEIGLTDEERERLWESSLSLAQYTEQSAESICGAQLTMTGLRLISKGNTNVKVENLEC